MRGLHMIAPGSVFSREGHVADVAAACSEHGLPGTSFPWSAVSPEYRSLDMTATSRE
jgi:hypothetical protein